MHRSVHLPLLKSRGLTLVFQVLCKHRLLLSQGFKGCETSLTQLTQSAAMSNRQREDKWESDGWTIHCSTLGQSANMEANMFTFLRARGNVIIWFETGLLPTITHTQRQNQRQIILSVISREEHPLSSLHVSIQNKVQVSCDFWLPQCSK